MTENIRIERRDPFAPPTTCPLCRGQNPQCRACRGTGEFIRTGTFVAHACSTCSDGARPERCPTKVPGNCGNLFARND